MSSKVPEKVKSFKINQPGAQCVFCKSFTVDEVNLGPIYTCENVSSHYYCLLFSAALSQRGRDEEGILGFLPVDILKEVRRSSRLKCGYCEQPLASVGCCKKSCKMAFHFPCGLMGGANYQFYGNYEAYCEDHAAPQDIVVKYKDWKCPICLCRVSHSEHPVMGSCCKSVVFHKECLKKMALNAGYFFKCPMCNSQKEFIQEMRALGVFVPEQDASWEREPNAFEDLLFQYSKCDAPVCVCDKGRDHNAARGGFILARCRVCGAAGVHRQCGNLRTVTKWACEACRGFEIKTAEERKKMKQENKTKLAICTEPNLGASCSTAIAGQASEAERKATWKLNILGMHKPFEYPEIHSTCINYFPYQKQQIPSFCKNGVLMLPDWRTLVLRVNLVDWLGKNIRNTNNLPPPSVPRIMFDGTVSFPPPVKLYRPRQPDENTPVVTCKYPNKKNAKKKIRTTKWRRGILTNKNRKGKVTSNSLTGVENDEANNRISLNEDNTKDLITELDWGEDKTITDHTGALFKVPDTPASKKRKVLELGHMMEVFGVSKDLFVQSNVEVPAEEDLSHSTTGEPDEIPLGSFTDKPVQMEENDTDEDCQDTNDKSTPTAWVSV